MIAWRVVKLRVLPGHRLEVEFADGLRGVVDMSRDDFSGLFQPLADEAYFQLASIKEGVVAWPNGVDVASDAMYAEISGEPLMPRSTTTDAVCNVDATGDGTDLNSIARIIALANATFSDQQKAMRWLRAKQIRFGGRSPIEVASTAQGARQVERALGQLDEGYF